MNQKHTETTEWEDLHIKLGNIAPKTVYRAPTELEYDDDSLQIKEHLESLKKEALENASLEQLEDLEDVEDEKVLERLRFRIAKQFLFLNLVQQNEKITRIKSESGKRKIWWLEINKRARLQIGSFASKRCLDRCFFV